MESVQKYLDKNGKIKVWPKRNADKEVVIAYLSTKFTPQKTYSEKDVNEIINLNHTFADHTLLRRELIERNYLTRTPDCKEYKKHLNCEANEIH